MHERVSGVGRAGVLATLLTAALAGVALPEGAAASTGHGRPRCAAKERPGKKPRIVRKAAPPPAADAPSPAPGAQATPDAPRAASPATEPAGSTSMSTAAVLARAQKLFLGLEYADVVKLTAQVLARPDVTVTERLDAYMLQGSSLAIIGDPIEAEKPFRFLLRGRPDYEPSPDTPPKILAVFRKVQVEERAIVEQMRELARQQAIKELEIKPEVPARATGGEPLVFSFRLKDPRSSVAAMEVHYRRGADEPYSVLALKIDEDGGWKGVLPGGATENDTGSVLEYFLSTRDAAASDLLSVGTASAPLALPLTPGHVTRDRPVLKTWWFWTASAAVAAAVGASVWLIHDRATSLPQTAGRIDLKE